MDALHLAGRIVVGLFFLMMAANHFTKADMLRPYAASKNVPMPGLMVPLTGLMMLAGGLSVLLGVLPDYGILLLDVFLVVTSFLMHRFWTVPEDQKMNEMNNFMKNLAIAGALTALLILPEPWPFSLGW